MIGFNFGRLGNNSDYFINTTLDYGVVTIVVNDENGNPIVGAKVEIVQQTVLFFTYTDENGEAIVQGENGKHYTLIISGERIETKELKDWAFENSTIQVEEKKFLEIHPEYIWLTRGNNYTDNVDVMSNVDWFIQ